MILALIFKNIIHNSRSGINILLSIYYPLKIQEIPVFGTDQLNLNTHLYYKSNAILENDV